MGEKRCAFNLLAGAALDVGGNEERFIGNPLQGGQGLGGVTYVAVEEDKSAKLMFFVQPAKALKIFVHPNRGRHIGAQSWKNDLRGFLSQLIHSFI